MKIKMHAAKFVFYLCLGTAIGLFVGGFFVPPMGVIDGSILKAGGILLGFSSLGIFGRMIDEGKMATYKKGDTEISVRSQDMQENT